MAEKQLVDVSLTASGKIKIGGVDTHYMKIYDPFLFCTKDGRIVPFQSLRTLYGYTLKLCYQCSKRGYLDLVLLLTEQTFLTFEQAQMVVQNSGVGMVNDVVILPWDEAGGKAEYRMAEIIKFLHTFTDTGFAEFTYFEAWDEFEHKTLKY